MRKPADDEMPQDVPTWLLTYSDVITLLMTFFILLLTFATSEPEKFERMQVAIFGGGGAMGIAGPIDGPLEQEAVLVRERPRSSRLTTRGSEMPPLDADPSYQSLSNGLAGLEEEEQREPATSHAIEVPLALFLTADGKITALGSQRLRMLARQLRKDPFELSIQVHSDEDIAQGLALARHLMQHEAIPNAKIGVGKVASAASLERSARLVLTRHTRSR